MTAQSAPSAGPGCAPGTYTTPLNTTWSAGANCSIAFTSPQNIGGSQYFFNSATVNGSNTTANPLTVGAGTASLGINAVFGSTVPPCTYTVSPTSQSFPHGGGSGSIVVTTSPGCTWTYSIQAAWIHQFSVIPIVVCNPPCPSNPPFRYFVDPNPGSTARTGTVTIAGQTVTITEAGTATCAYSIKPTELTFTSSGGSGVVQVSTSTGCTWSVVNNTTFVGITSISSTSGNGSVSFSLATNTGGPRSATLTIAGQPFTVMQNGYACGATDVSGKVTVTQGPMNLFDAVNYPPLWDRSITLTNVSGAPIPGPIYLVLDGLPTYSPGVCQNGCGLIDPPLGTTYTSCPTLTRSSAGSYLVPWIPGGLGPNQSYPTQQNPFCGASPTSPPCFGLDFIGSGTAVQSYTLIILSGAPSQ